MHSHQAAASISCQKQHSGSNLTSAHRRQAHNPTYPRSYDIPRHPITTTGRVITDPEVHLRKQSVDQGDKTLAPRRFSTGHILPQQPRFTPRVHYTARIQFTPTEKNDDDNMQNLQHPYEQGRQSDGFGWNVAQTGVEERSDLDRMRYAICMREVDRIRGAVTPRYISPSSGSSGRTSPRVQENTTNPTEPRKRQTERIAISRESYEAGRSFEDDDVFFPGDLQ